MTYDKHFFNQINYFYRFFLKTEKLSCPLSFISVNSKRVFICYSLTLKHILNFSFFKVLKLPYNNFVDVKISSVFVLPI